jgi:hypothetical protein
MDLDIFGQKRQIELIPNGQNIRVTQQTILEYIHRFANLKQNILIQSICQAFLSGFRVMIPLIWLRMFGVHELQLLISGEQRPLNIQDMKQHVIYSNGYHLSQEYIQWFWEILEYDMSLEDQSLFLKFVTSCPRQPLLGFQSLTPKFCIQQVSPYNDIPLGADELLRQRYLESKEMAKLPTAATCMNLLKLPKYFTKEQLQERLLYAIRSNSGFELS